MPFNYQGIKALAKQTGRRVTDLLALAPKNDPFYAGMPASVESAEWFSDIWQRTGYTSGIHIRRVHYWTVSQNTPILLPNGLPYENDDQCWDYLSQASKMARYLGLVRIEQIIDNKNPKPHIHAVYSQFGPSFEINVPNLDDPYVWVNGINGIDAQPYHLEVWCEKSTMNDVLLPLCQRYNANLATFEGEVSIGSCYDVAKRIEASGGKPTRIWYISDFDPAGNSMPVAMSRKVEYMLQYCGQAADLRIRPLALTSAQVEEYALPRTPIKKKEKRAAKFEQAFGAGACELDALEALYPGTLARLVETELATYYSQRADLQALELRGELGDVVTERINAITAHYQAEIEAVQGMVDELRAIRIDASEYAIDRLNPHVEEQDEWLFDSTRDYEQQIAFYKAHKGQTSGAADRDAA